MDNRRICYLDFLRVTAIFFVVIIHVTSVGLHTYDVFSGPWLMNSLLNSISRWAVPVFFMISGSLFLSPEKELSIKKLYKNNILHIVICIIVWGSFYSLLDQYIYNTLSIKSILIAVYGIITGTSGYHLWFLYTLTMLYIAIPLFRLITAHATKQQLEYGLLIWFIFSLLISQINAFAEDLGITSELLPYSAFIISGYGGYFLLGYYLSIYPIRKKAKRWLYAAGILSLLIIIMGKLLFKTVLHQDLTALEAPLGVFSCLLATSIFTIAQNMHFTNTCESVFVFCGQHTFGIYLTHVFFISLLYHIIGIAPNYCAPLLSIILSSIGIFAVSLLTSLIMSKIPLLRNLV
mgnify:CR=1 FL=1